MKSPANPDLEKKPQEWAQFFSQWFHDQKLCARGEMTSNLYPYDKLFEPIRINRLTLRNRIVMAPMGNVCMADENGRPSEAMIKYFTERAAGGVGLITTGLIPLATKQDPSLHQKEKLSIFPRIDQRTTWSGWRDLARSLHAHGTKLFVQLSPGLGRNGNPECLMTKTKLPVSASWNPSFYMPDLLCRPLTDREIRKIVKITGQAASDAQTMLADGVYLHGHMGYLIEQLTDPAFNRRKLGIYRNWKKFGIDLVKEIRKRCGASYPIMYRIDLSLMLKATYGEEMAKTPALKRFQKERTVAMTLSLMEDLVAAGVDMFDVDLGCYDNLWIPHLSGEMPPGAFLDVARTVKRHFTEKGIKSNAGLPVPVVAVGKLGYPDLAEQALRDEDCDMIMLGRPLLADPQWPNKVFAGRVNEIRPCIGDLEGCVHEYTEGGHPVCAVNPRCSFETIYPKTPSKTANAKKIAVIGAGPAGIECACTAAKRGHDVTLFEKKANPGGTLIPGSAPPIKFDVKNYIRYSETRLKRVSENHKLTMKFDTAVTADELKAMNFDSIITATGANPVQLPIPGMKESGVVDAIDLLDDPSIAKGTNSAVVIGGGVVGCETAHFLAYDLGVDQVTVVEMLPHFMIMSNTPTRGYLIHHLKEKSVQLLNCTQVTEIRKGAVIVSQNTHRSVPDPYNTWSPILPGNVVNPLEKKIKMKATPRAIAGDLIVNAVGVRPNSGLFNDCIKNHAADTVLNIGDSHTGGRVLEAVKAGYETAINL